MQLTDILNGIMEDAKSQIIRSYNSKGLKASGDTERGLEVKNRGHRNRSRCFEALRSVSYPVS